MSITPELTARLFENAPHVAVLLGTDLSIIGVNAAARRFLGGEAAAIEGRRLFDLLPPGVVSGETWQDRLQASYAVLRSTQRPVTLLLPARDGVGADDIARAGPVAKSAIWYVCHAPVLDDDGRLMAIATYAQSLEGVEIAIARVSGYATTQRAAAPPVPVGADRSAPTVSPAAATAAVQAGGTELQILVVEDNDDLRTTTCEHLAFLGHHVTSAGDAEQAIRHLEVSRFDLLFTDLTLPKMTGAELARQVLNREQPMQVIITSGYGRALANAQNLDALFLPKPYRIVDLEDVLAQVRVRLGQVAG